MEFYVRLTSHTQFTLQNHPPQFRTKSNDFTSQRCTKNYTTTIWTQYRLQVTHRNRFIPQFRLSFSPIRLILLSYRFAPAKLWTTFCPGSRMLKLLRWKPLIGQSSNFLGGAFFLSQSESLLLHMGQGRICHLDKMAAPISKHFTRVLTNWR